MTGARAYAQLADTPKGAEEGTPMDEICPASKRGAEASTCGAADAHVGLRSRMSTCLDDLRQMEGMLAVAASALLFSVMAACVSFLGAIFPATQMMLVRSIIQATISWSYLRKQGLAMLGSPEVRRWVMLRGAFGAMGNWVLFFSVTQIPMGDANAIIFTGPVFTAVLAYLLLGEPLLRLEVGALLLSIVGVTLVSRPPFLFGPAAPGVGGAPGVHAQGAQRQLTVGICVLGAALNGSIFIIVRRVGTAAHWMAFVFAFSLCGISMSALGLLLGLQECRWPPLAEVGLAPYALLVAVGLLASVGQSFFNLGMQREKPAVASITSQLGVPLAYAWQTLCFGQPAGPESLLGSALVLLSTSTVLGRRLLCAPPAAPGPAAAAAGGGGKGLKSEAATPDASGERGALARSA